jgi:hypothetical protein
MLNATQDGVNAALTKRFGMCADLLRNLSSPVEDSIRRR